MSPEINGNPPSVTKRKKNREKKPQQTKLNPLEFNMSNCNYFPTNPNTYHNVSIPDITAYYSVLNYSNPSEPMSLPVYPMNYPNYYPSNPNLNFMSTPKPPIVPSMNGDNEYLSLPVGSLDQNDDVTKRRYSDPGLPNDSDDSGNSIENKIIEKLTHQVNVLKESNRKLTREVMEMRIELNMLKQQQGSRHYDREYEPGMLADIIREVRDAARVREDALLAKVKHMIEEKQLSMQMCGDT
ncbi:rho-associated protein kinase 1 [Asbolus verrucosus]|uniref:Rho-associated protein kinase 1 n=1 Tax=Asbolus verrucosus TaxID=1661398 RepID=A0A482VHW7_ASBVE|nr:rho-associated protein kinase 1 [Asbolus verrucosus]